MPRYGRADGRRLTLQVSLCGMPAETADDATNAPLQHSATRERSEQLLQLAEWVIVTAASRRCSAITPSKPVRTLRMPGHCVTPQLTAL